MKQFSLKIRYFLPLTSIFATFYVANPSEAALIGGEVGGRYNGRFGTSAEEYQSVDITIFDTPPEEIFFSGLGAGHNPPFQQNPDKSRDIRVLNERQNFALEEDITIWSGLAQIGEGRISAADTLISAGTLVSSHLIWVNPPGATVAGTDSAPRFYWDGFLAFDGDILGIIPNGRDEPTLGDTSAIFGLPEVNYLRFRSGLDIGQCASRRGCDDVVTAQGNILNITSIGAQWGYEPFRVITTQSASVPEPLTILGSATALGFGGWFKRRLAKK